MSIRIERKLTREQVEKVRAALAAEKINLVGDAGSFKDKIGGTFSYDGTTLTIDVTDKPMLAKWAWVQDRVEKELTEAIS